MARGWESKSVGDQIESARARREGPKIQLTTEQIETERKCDSLLLHRTRVLHDLEKCSDERYRKTLTQGLTYLETQLMALGWQQAE